MLVPPPRHALDDNFNLMLWLLWQPFRWALWLAAAWAIAAWALEK